MLLLTLIESTSVFLVFSYAYCWSPGAPPFRAEPVAPSRRIKTFVFFTAMSILGTYLGPRLPGGSIANTRAVGAVLAGLLGGPALGLSVGTAAGLHRITLGGITAVGGAIATALEGLIGGLVHRRLARTAPERVVSWQTGALVTAGGEVLHQLILLAVSRPLPETIALVKVIALPMILSNALGAALFMTMLRHRREVYDTIGAASSAFALRVAQRTIDVLKTGFGREVAGDVAGIIREETGVSAVAITDLERVLAFSGLGSDHHPSGGPISSVYTQRAIAENGVVFADGQTLRFRCALSPRCPLGSVVVVPLHVDGQVIGTVQLFERTARRFGTANRTLGEGLGALLSSQLVLSRYQEQKNLLLTTELKLLRAQVNPHFLFNSLNTIIGITREDPGRARALLAHLSNYFRKNLKRNTELSTLQEELDHVGSYLQIETARFERLVVETDVDPALLAVLLPTFTLQPLVENAIRHGVSASMGDARARIRAYRADGEILIDIEDTAGAYDEAAMDQGGLGMKIVDKRIKNLAGKRYGVSVDCIPHELTRVRVRLPAAGIAQD
jgi:two-component system, LytTR family, sensor kinase